MNEIQQSEFNLLKECIRICEELSLKWYLVCGSALGAIKYNGFIPWDDDIDIALPRPDYDIFIENAQNLLPDYYFLQNCHTDSKYPLYMSKLRDSRTTFIENLYSTIPMNHGIYIDVFPLDGYPPKSIAKKFERKKSRYNRQRSVRYNYNRFSPNNIIHVKAIISYLLFKVFGVNGNTEKVLTKFERLTGEYDCYESDLWCNFGNWQGKLDYAPREQYGDGTWAFFEGLKVRVPEKYDEYLTQKYGNWRLDPPVEMQVPSHGHIVDTQHPYTDYIIELNNRYIRLKTVE